MLVQEFKANASVEAFDESIGNGFARPAEVQDDTVRISLQVELVRGELAAVAHPDASRFCARHWWLMSGLPRFDSNMQLSSSATLGALNPRHCRCQKQQDEYATDNFKYNHCSIL